MNTLLLFALVAFLAGAVVSAIQKAWVTVLLCVGLALVVAAESGLVH